MTYVEFNYDYEYGPYCDEHLAIILDDNDLITDTYPAEPGCTCTACEQRKND